MLAKTQYRLCFIALMLVAVAMTFGSCRKNKNSNEPVKAKRLVILALDAAHGGDDVGAISQNGTQEKDVTLKLCDKLSALAGAYNIIVVRTRDTDKTIWFEERAEIANNAKADLFLSLHINKNAPNNLVSKGFDIMVSEKNAKFPESKNLASAIAGRLRIAGTPIVHTQKGVLVLELNNCPAVAIECGNMDIPEEMATIENEDKLEALCRTLLSGIVDYVNAK